LSESLPSLHDKAADKCRAIIINFMIILNNNRCHVLGIGLVSGVRYMVEKR